MTSPREIAGLREVADTVDGVFVDQYGVMHDGQHPYPGAVEALTRLVEAGRTVMVLTNSGKRAAPNIARIVGVGFPRDSFTGLVSSGEVAWSGLRDGRFGAPFGPGHRLGLVGKAGSDYGLDDLGLTFTDDWARADGLLVLGSDCPRTSLDDYRRLLGPAAARGAPALCSNPDLVMLTRMGLQPSAGAIAAAYRDLGGHVAYVGKPHAAIYAEAQHRAGIGGARVLAIGDSLDHDIAGGAAARLRTALVRTGVLAGVGPASFERIMADAPHRPDYVLPSLLW